MVLKNGETLNPKKKALIAEMQSIILFYQTKNLCCLEMDFKMNLFIENQFCGELSLKLVKYALNEYLSL